MEIIEVGTDPILLMGMATYFKSNNVQIPVLVDSLTRSIVLGWNEGEYARVLALHDAGSGPVAPDAAAHAGHGPQSPAPVVVEPSPAVGGTAAVQYVPGRLD